MLNILKARSTYIAIPGDLNSSPQWTQASSCNQGHMLTHEQVPFVEESWTLTSYNIKLGGENPPTQSTMYQQGGGQREGGAPGPGNTLTYSKTRTDITDQRGGQLLMTSLNLSLHLHYTERWVCYLAYPLLRKRKTSDRGSGLCDNIMTSLVTALTEKRSKVMEQESVDDLKQIKEDHLVTSHPSAFHLRRKAVGYNSKLWELPSNFTVYVSMFTCQTGDFHAVTSACHVTSLTCKFNMCTNRCVCECVYIILTEELDFLKN